MFDHQSVKGLVVVERSNDVVAKRPGVVDHMVDLETGAFTEPHHIEPMPPPLLAVARRRQQPIDEFFVCVGRRVADKRVNFLGRRRQACQIVGHATDKRTLVGRWVRLKARRGKSRVDEAIDWIRAPVGRDSGGRRLAGREWLERPPALVSFRTSFTTNPSGQCAPSAIHSRRHCHFVWRKRRSLLGHHRLLAAARRYDFQQIAFVRLAGEHIFVGCQVGKRRQRQTGFLVRRLMTANAMLLQNGRDIAQNPAAVSQGLQQEPALAELRERRPATPELDIGSSSQCPDHGNRLLFHRLRPQLR